MSITIVLPFHLSSQLSAVAMYLACVSMYEYALLSALQRPLLAPVMFKFYV